MSGLFKSPTLHNSDTMALGMKVQTSAYGLAVPIVYGRTRVAGNMIWYGDFVAIPHTTTTSSGGKGGGGIKQENTTYTYQAAIAMALCEGPIMAINAVWADKDYIPTAISAGLINAPTTTKEIQILFGTMRQIVVKEYAHFYQDVSVYYYSNDNTGVSQKYLTRDYTVSNGIYTFGSSVPAGVWLEVTYVYIKQVSATPIFSDDWMGSYPQTPWSYLTSKHPGQDLNYPGIAYIANGAYDLGGQPTLRNHNFDVTGRLPYASGTIDSANPADIITDLLTNTHYGAAIPNGILGNLTAFSNYCVAAGLFLSPAYTSQKAAHELLTALLDMTNSGAYFSEGMIKVVPFGDAALSGNGAVYTPNVTPLYNLTDNDFITSGSEDPITVHRGTPADAFNRVLVEYLDASNQFNVAVIEATDQANIETYGLRSMDTKSAHEITDSTTARQVAQNLLQRSLYIRNTYEFKLSWRYCLLEPTDYVTITDTALGYSNYPVRITQIEEDDTGLLSITAEDAPPGISSASRYPAPNSQELMAHTNVLPGPTSPPVIFEAPASLTTGGGLEVWIGACGGPSWGGASVWVSDDNASYRKVGAITAPAKMGYLTAPLAKSTIDPDVVNTLSVDLSMSRSALIGGTQQDADKYNTLCYADGELLAFATSTLTASYAYNLTYLRRGAYNSTISNHAAATQFMRLDEAVFRYPFTSDRIGTPLYIKFTAFNTFGGSEQSLSDVSPVTYLIQGQAQQTPPPDVQNLTGNFVAGLYTLRWDPVSDFRSSSIDYEIRIGPTWAISNVVGRTPMTSFVPVANGTYWIAAHYQTAEGVNTYSLNPAAITVTGAALTRNVVASFDQLATGWLGTTTGNLVLTANQLELAATGDILSVTDVLSLVDVLWYGGTIASGGYELPASQAVNIGRVDACNVTMAYTGYALSIYDNVLTAPDMLTNPDILGTLLGPNITIQPQIAVAGADGIYGAWTNFSPGSYSAQYFKGRYLVSSVSSVVSVVITDLVFAVDVPDRIDSYQATTSATGSTSISYPTPFNGGNGALALPTIQGTIISAGAGDDLVVSVQSLSGCTFDVYNAGARVARTVNIQVQGY